MLKAIEWRTVLGVLLILGGSSRAKLMHGFSLNEHIQTGFLATGLPTISADLPELYQHRDVLEVVDGLEAWDAALCRAVAGEAPGSTEARQAVAREHSWDRRVDDLDGWLRSLSRSEAASR